MKLGVIKLSDIEVGERFREDYGDLDQLINSIKESGVIQPLAIYERPNSPYLLLAGGRRYKAISMAGIEEAPARIYDTPLTEDQIRIIELSENFYRKDLSWLETIKLKREIHRLQQSIYGEKTSTSPDAPGWGMKETAEQLGISKGSVSQDIALADTVEAFPDLFIGVKTKHEAVKLASKLGETIIREELAKKIQEQQLSNPVTDLIKSYIFMDFFKGVKQIPDGSIHLCEIDPPYGIALDEVKKGGDTMHYNEVEAGKYVDFLSQTFREAYRVLTDHSWLICWFGPDPWFEVIHKLILEAGFSCNRLCGIWVKPGGQSHNPETNLANAYEMFFWAKKGSPMLSKPGRTNVFQYNPVPPTQKIHPTERPIEMMEDIYSTFALPGSRILIPFLGSGSGLIAARNQGMNAFGFELSREYRDSFIVRVHKMM